MNVCLLNDSFPPVIDGVANTVMNYAQVLTAQGDKALVGTPRYPDADYTGYPYEVIPYQSFDTESIVSGYRAGNPLAMDAVAEMKAFHPDIIHSHCPAASTIMARVLRNETDAPIVFTYHTKFDVDIARAFKAEFMQRESARFMVNNIESCDEVWTVSEGAADNLRSLGFTGETRVMVNGVDFAKGRAADDLVIKATKDYDLPAEVPVFLFVGRIMNYKGLPLIIDALEMVHKVSRADFRMVFVGGGLDADALKEAAIQKGLQDKVIFTGPIHDRELLRAWNTRATLFLFPSTYDTNGIVVREAAACGLASVLIKGSCAAEGIADNRNGFLIEEDPMLMAGLLTEICHNMNKAHDAGQHAMDEIYLSWEDSVHTAYERYGEILDLKKAGAYEKRRHIKTNFSLKVAASYAQWMEELVKKPRALYEGMQENFSEGFDELREYGHNLKHFMEQMTGDIKDITNEVKKSLGDSDS
ncbi:MAG: glycosyltransferase [Lachnospiraceae bacterium]|nr:glycosyltransferase [Lachnospiraceae bacterium]